MGHWRTDYKGPRAAQNTVAWPMVAEVKKRVESGFIVKAELRGVADTQKGRRGS